MIDTDVYGAAVLAGGIGRAIDTALVVLVESGRVRVARQGELSVVDRRARHEVEAAVLDAIGSSGARSTATVHWKAGKDVRLTGLAGRLTGEGLLRDPRHRHRWSSRLTPEGRRLLRSLRGSGDGELAIALHGPRRMSDATLRASLFGADKAERVPRGGPGGRRRHRGYGATYGAGGYGAGAYVYGSSSCGGGSSSCGGGSGSSCGGGSGGGGGCGGGGGGGCGGGGG